MRTNRALALFAGIAIVVSLLSAGCGRTDVQTEESPAAVHAPFDSGAWKADAPGVRNRMAEDLISRQLLIGKSPAEVKALLGAPDRDAQGLMDYFVFSGPVNSGRPAYVVRVEFDHHADHVADARIDTDTNDFDMD
jgi:hypothetical protein